MENQNDELDEITTDQKIIDHCEKESSLRCEKLKKKFEKEDQKIMTFFLILTIGFIGASWFFWPFKKINSVKTTQKNKFNNQSIMRTIASVNREQPSEITIIKSRKIPQKIDKIKSSLDLFMKPKIVKRAKRNPAKDKNLKKEFYDNGVLKKKIHLKNHQKHGPTTWYHPNGQIWVEYNYFEGKENGTRLIYNDKGVLVKKISFSKGRKLASVNLTY